MKNNQTEKLDAKTDLTMRIIATMEEAIKWEKPWSANFIRPCNGTTGVPYSGANILSLNTYGFSDNRFFSGANINKMYLESEGKIHVKKGSIACRILFAKPIELNEKESDGLTDKRAFIWKYHPVFNAEQIEGVPLLQTQVQKFEDFEKAEIILRSMQATGLQFKHEGGQAFYSPSNDLVQMPNKSAFHTQEGYYSTLMHELAHATMHESRNNRQNNPRIKTEYAYEELVAELSSIFTCQSIGMNYDSSQHENHSAYLKSWVKILKDDKQAIFQLQV